MTSTELSSEDSADLYVGRRQRNGNRNLSSKVGNLASKLQDTNKTLKVVDQMLDDYKGLGEQQSHVMDRLREDLDRTTGQLQDEKMRRSLRESARSLRPSDLDDDLPRDLETWFMALDQDTQELERRRRSPTSPLRDYDDGADWEHPASDAEYSRRRRRQLRGAVRFFDDMDAQGNRHAIHQSLRDLTSGQLRLEDDLGREVDRRTRLEIDHRRSMGDLRMAQEPAPMTSVDRRLLSIQDELRAERASLKKRQDEVGKISSELKEALQIQKSAAKPPSGGAEDIGIRTRLVQVEAQKTQAESELESIRRRLDQAEGGRELLLDQTEELRMQLGRSDQEKQRLVALISEQEDDLRDRRKHRTVEEFERQQFEAERRRLEEEVRELRTQITKSASVMGEYNEMRKELDRSEKQRMQLSDHIQVLNKDLEAKEKQSLRVMAQLQELTSRYQDADHHSHSSLTQLEDALKRLRDTTQAADTYSAQLKEAQRKLGESEKRREEIKNRAQETVRQWKVKCKKLEKEAERQHHAASSAGEQNKTLTKEVEGLRQSANSGGQQVEQMRRQMAELLAMRAQMDEQLRIRDVEVNELKSLKMDLERDLRDCKVVIERLEHELRTANEKTTTFFEERNKLEDQVGSLQTAHYMAQNQLQQLQSELKQYGLEKVEITSQLAEVAGERNELKASLSELRRSEAAAREEIEQLNGKMKEERELQASRFEVMKAEVEQTKAREQHIITDLSRRYKKERAEYEAEVQALRLEIQEERSGSKLHRKQQEKLKAEIERLHQELTQSQEETAAGRRKYHRIKEEILAKAQATEDGLGRVKEMELHLLDTKETLLHVEKDYQNILYSIGVEVDSVVEVAALDSIETYKALNPLKAMPNEPQKWFAEMKGKLSWLRSELRERHQTEKKLRSNIRDVMETGTKEQLFYTNDSQPAVGEQTGRGGYDSQRRADTLDYTARTQDFAERDFQHTNMTAFTPRQTEDFGTTEEIERELAIHRSFLADHEKDVVVDNIKSTETQRERERINERYAKLQEAMVGLRQELTSQNSNNQEESLESPPARRYHVRAATPPVQDTPSPAHKSRRPAHTPPPLSLSDEEFTNRFMPHTPVTREQIVM